MLASELIERAQIIIQDVLGVRWPLTELCMWLNDGQRDIAVQKPSANSRITELPIKEGTRQELDAKFVALLRPVRNLEAGIHSSVVTVVSRDLMDAQAPNWHAKRPRKAVRHIMFDEADPRTFYVYPPNDGTGLMETVVSVLPVVFQPTGYADELESYAAPIELRDEYTSPLVDYILYRAYSKDAQNAGAAQRAQLHYGLYANAVGIKAAVEANMSPNAKARIAAAAGGVSQA